MSDKQDFNIIPLKSTVSFEKKDNENQLSFLDITNVRERNSVQINCPEIPELGQKVTINKITRKVIELNGLIIF